MFAKTLPYKASIKERTFEDYIINTNKNLSTVYKHYKYPTKKLLKIVKSKESTRKRTSKIWFSFQNAKTDKDLFKTHFVTRWAPIESTYLYDMLIELYDLENNGSLDIIYSFLEYKYSKQRMIEIHNSIYSILVQVLNNPKINIEEIDFKQNILI